MVCLQTEFKIVIPGNLAKKNYLGKFIKYTISASTCNMANNAPPPHPKETVDKRFSIDLQINTFTLIHIHTIVNG